jgi:hypothetical protein
MTHLRLDKTPKLGVHQTGSSSPCVIQMKRRLQLTSLVSNLELAIQTNRLLTEQALRGVLLAMEE